MGEWASIENQRARIEAIGKNFLGVTRLEDWYKQRTSDISKHGGSAIWFYYNWSFVDMLRAIYPHHTWHPWLFKRVPHDYWKSMERRRLYISWLSEQLNIERLEDWYSVSVDAVRRNYAGSRFLSQCYKGSLNLALRDLYPNHTWKVWRFRHSRVPSQFWKNRNNQKELFEHLATTMKHTQWEDWYSVKYDDLVFHGASGVVSRQYQGSLHKALTSIFPEHEWLPWLFSTLPRNYWSNIENQRSFFDWCATHHLGFKDARDLDGWKKVNRRALEAIPGSPNTLVADHYGDSLERALATIYPWHSWILSTNITHSSSSFSSDTTTNTANTANTTTSTM
jgi:hypothetical protein